MAELANPFDTPSPRGIRLVQATLRVVTAVQCFGMAAGQLHLHRPWALFESLGPVYGMGSDQLSHVQRIVAFALVGSGLLTLIRPCWLILLPVVILQIASALGPAIPSEAWWDWLACGRWGAICAIPAALLLVDLWPPRVKPTLLLSLSAVSLLRLGTVLSFAVQGMRGMAQFEHGGPAAAMLQQAASAAFQQEISPETARQILGLGAGLSLALALCLLVTRSRLIAALCVIWGGGLAAVHTLAHGVGGYDHTLMRAGDAGAPLAIWLFWMLAVKDPPPEYLPEPDSR